MPRQPAQWTSRPCKRCGDIYPREEYIIAKRDTTTTNTLCQSCYRAYQREHKRDEYERRRQIILDRARDYRATRMPDNVDEKRHDRISRIAWVINRCMVRLGDTKPTSMIVYIIPGVGGIPDHPRSAERPWRKRDWALREERPGMTPPRGGIPIMRLNGTNAIVHALCPDEWQWVAKYTGNWLRRRHREAE